MNVTIAIGADHRGFLLKDFLKDYKYPPSYALMWRDIGAFTAERSDYPCFVPPVCHLILEEKADKGILICGSGQGMAVAANRFRGIYAGVAWNETIARVGKEDDNINVLVLPADFITHEQAVASVIAWLGATFKGNRYAERLMVIDSIEDNICVS